MDEEKSEIPTTGPTGAAPENATTDHRASEVTAPSASKLATDDPNRSVGEHLSPLRWNIAEFLFYSHNGKRRLLSLRPSAVNIITGNSHTGKSAVAEVIDYVMGADECHIPGRVRNATSWVGLRWVRGNTNVVMCRRMPSADAKANGDMLVLVGRDVASPESAADIVPNANRNGALKKFEQLIGLGQVETEVFGSETRSPVRISFRNALPYLLQDDDTIISKNVLLRGQSDERKQSIIETLPYFVGAVDEATVAQEGELRRLETQVALAERRELARRRLLGDEDERARSLLREAAQVGLLAPGASSDVAKGLSPAEARATLVALLERPEPLDPVAVDEQLDALYSVERELAERVADLRRQITSTKGALAAASEFVATAETQRDRLAVVDLYPALAAPARRRDSRGRHGHGAAEPNSPPKLDNCPLCEQTLPVHAPSVVEVRDVLDRVARELNDVARERPKLDRAVVQLEKRRADAAAELADIRRSIASLVRESELRAAQQDLRARQQRVLGRISLYLDTANPVQTVSDDDPLDALRARVAALSEILNSKSKEERVKMAIERIAFTATHLVDRLPLDPRYRNSPVFFDARTLDVGITAMHRRVSLRDIGSDENYLTLHVSLALAFQRLFGELARPVPGFLLFDQLSRPYYPPDPEQLERRKETVESATAREVQPLRSYFEALFEEVDRSPGLQVLVLEHAYFSDDERFRAATVERWIDEKALIPGEWPEAAPNTQVLSA